MRYCSYAIEQCIKVHRIQQKSKAVAPQLSEGKHICFVNINGLYMMSVGRDFNREHSLKHFISIVPSETFPNRRLSSYRSYIIICNPKGRCLFKCPQGRGYHPTGIRIEVRESKSSVISLLRFRFEHSTPITISNSASSKTYFHTWRRRLTCAF